MTIFEEWLRYQRKQVPSKILKEACPSKPPIKILDVKTSKFLGLVAQDQFEELCKFIIKQGLGKCISKHFPSRSVHKAERISSHMRSDQPNLVLNVLSLVRDSHI